MKYCLIILLGCSLIGCLIFVPCENNACARVNEGGSSSSYHDAAWNVYCQVRWGVRKAVSAMFRLFNNATKSLRAKSDPRSAALTSPLTSAEGEFKGLREAINEQAAILRHNVRGFKKRCINFLNVDNDAEVDCDCHGSTIKIN